METGTARYGPVRRVVWGPEANYLRLPDSPSVFHSLWVQYREARFDLVGIGGLGSEAKDIG